MKVFIKKHLWKILVIGGLISSFQVIFYLAATESTNFWEAFAIFTVFCIIFVLPGCILLGIKVRSSRKLIGNIIIGTSILLMLLGIIYVTR